MSDLGNIGSASVTVEADFTKLVADARAISHVLPNPVLNVEADTTAARADIERLDGEIVKVRLELAQKELDKLRKKLRDEHEKSGKESGLAFAKGFARELAGAGIGGRLVAAIKPAAVVAAIGVVAEAASNAVSGVVALTGSLSALGGVTAALPDIFLAAGSAMGVVKLGLQGVTDAVGGLNDKMDPKKLAALTPAGQSFAKTLDGLKPRIRSFQEDIQAVLLPKFTRAIQIATPAVEALEGPLVGTASAVGSLAVNLAKALSSVRGELGPLIAFNAQLTTVVGQAAITLGRTFVDALVVARPLIRFLAVGFAEMLRAASAGIQGLIASGGLAAFFRQTAKSAALLAHLLGSVGSILGSLFKASVPTGNLLLTLLNQQAAALAKFVASPKGQKGLRQFFADGIPALKEMGRLIRDVFVDFVRLGKGKDLAGIIKAIRVELLPPIVELVDQTRKNFVPVLIPALKNITKVMIDLGGTNGPLTKIVRTMGDFAGWVDKLFKNHPAVASFVSSFLTLTSLIKIGTIIGKLSGLGTVFKLFGGIAKDLVMWLGERGGLLGVFRGIGGFIATRIVPLFSRLGAIWDVLILGAEAVGTAIAGIAAVIGAPVALVVAAIAGIGIALALLIRHFGAWKAGVHIIVAAVRATFASWLVGVRVIFSAAAGAARGFLAAAVAVFHAAIGAAQSFLSGLGHALGAVGGVFRSAWHTAAAFLRGVDLTAIGSKIIHTFLDGLKAGFEDVKHFIGGIAKWIKDHKGPVSADAKLLVPAGRAIMHGFDKGLHDRWHGVRHWVTSIGGYFRDAVSGQSLNATISNILLGRGTVASLNNQLSAAIGIPAAALAGGQFFHPSSGAADTAAQGMLLRKMFGLGGWSQGQFTGGGHAAHSLHYAGRAIDFSQGSNAALTRLAAFTGRLARVFQEVFWLNQLWLPSGSPHGFIADHMDHVHVGWLPRAAGGQVRKGQGYTWNERGREMFVPHQGGYVMNAGKTRDLIEALRGLKTVQNTRNATIHVHPTAADPRHVGATLLGKLGGVFAIA